MTLKPSNISTRPSMRSRPIGNVRESRRLSELKRVVEVRVAGGEREQFTVDAALGPLGDEACSSLPADAH